ncbi:MAG: hypothetical protein HY794_02390 [Desulfarculus sp.]|nr:hypothetical protein [Desulfarculus sp.]
MLELNAKAEVIIASGYTTGMRERLAPSVGTDAFVGKSFKKAQLLATVRSAPVIK